MKKGLQMLLILLCLGSLGMFGYHSLQFHQSEGIYENAAELAKGAEDAEEDPFTDDPYMTSLQDTDLEALREVNPDVLGWILIPDTQLEYPLMKGLDNQYYLEHTWDKKRSAAGSVFLEQTSSEDLSDTHTVIYGHRMRDGSMFGSLGDYKKLEYWEKHPYVYIVDDHGVHRYQIFAAYEADIGSKTYQVGFSGEESMQAFLDHCVQSSVIDTDIEPLADDRILTLSTCTAAGHNNLRWVVQARLYGQCQNGL